MTMFTVKVGQESFEYSQGVTLLDVAKQFNTPYYAAKVNNRLRELSYTLTKDCSVEFLDLTNADAVKIYESSLRFVVAMALHRLYPKSSIKFNYSVSRSILGIIDNFGKSLDNEGVYEIIEEVERIVASDYPITRRTVEIDEAMNNYQEHGMQDKVDVLKYREEDTVNMYECNQYTNYMFGYMVPSTGFLKHFNIRHYHPGIIIQYPRSEYGGKIQPFMDAPNFSKALKEASKWGKIVQGDTIAKMNNYVENNQAVDFVNMCETKHNNMLAELGEMIQKDIENIRLIAVAGPSSSGKTTFTNRLRIELMSKGIRPVMISIDDYYLGKHMAPKDEFGQPDLEHLEALDVELFNKHILSLIQGNKVTLPHFNFKTGTREVGKVVQIDENTPLLIEGIHALNEQLTASIPKHQKFKIYIAPQIQLHIDNHNPISITDLRLLRRIVRDKKYRNSSATDTMAMWPSVRRGEFKWIYPNQEGADYVFNSELTYEINVMKKHALSNLIAIPRDSEHFITANRLLKFLKYFKEIDDELVPCNSILREFIGGSCFH